MKPEEKKALQNQYKNGIVISCRAHELPEKFLTVIRIEEERNANNRRVFK